MPLPPGTAHGRDDDRAGEGDDSDSDPDGTGTSTENDAGSHRAATRRRWASLLRRVFQSDALVCPSCKGPRRILAAITEREPIDKILSHLGLSTEIPVVEKARPPPQSDFAFD